jgi:hypothetical protein
LEHDNRELTGKQNYPSAWHLIPEDCELQLMNQYGLGWNMQKYKSVLELTIDHFAFKISYGTHRSYTAKAIM